MRSARFKIRFWNDQVEKSAYTSEISDTELFIEMRPAKIKVGMRLHLEVSFKSGPYFAEGEVVKIKRIPAGAAAVAVGGIRIRLVPWAKALEKAGFAAPQGASGEATSDEVGPLTLNLRDLEAVRGVLQIDVRDGIFFIETRDLPEIGTKVNVQVVLPEPCDPFEVEGKVVNIREDPPAVTVQLTSPGEVRDILTSALRPVTMAAQRRRPGLIR